MLTTSCGRFYFSPLSYQLTLAFVWPYLFLSSLTMADHGAYYYYNFGNATAQDVLLNVSAYAQAEGIPYRGVLLDSWWYWKGTGGGVKNWTAMPG
jgi:hypothetical protein